MRLLWLSNSQGQVAVLVPVNGVHDAARLQSATAQLQGVHWQDKRQSWSDLFARYRLLLGLFLGFAGASFAVALPLASQWYPPQHQGKAMGIAGADNSGTVLAALFAPGLAALFGWNNVFGLALIPLSIVFVIYLVMAKDAPECPPAKSMAEYLKVLKDKDAWWFMFFYSVTFGGFVGLARTF